MGTRATLNTLAQRTEEATSSCSPSPETWDQQRARKPGHDPSIASPIEDPGLCSHPSHRPPTTDHPQPTTRAGNYVPTPRGGLVSGDCLESPSHEMWFAARRKDISHAWVQTGRKLGHGRAPSSNTCELVKAWLEDGKCGWRALHPPSDSGQATTGPAAGMRCHPPV